MFLVHEKFMDVFFEVIKTQYRGPRYKRVRGRWWNLGFTGNPFIIDLKPQTIKIMHGDTNWKFFNPNNPHTHPGRK